MQLAQLSSAALAGDVEPVVSWVADAWAPYGEWLLDGRERVREVTRAWLARPSSELAITEVTALVDGEEHTGGYVAVGGAELLRRRKADLVWLLEYCRHPDRADLLHRLRDARDLFAPVPDTHCYLSKIGVLEAFRGRGLGTQLLDAFVERSFAAGFETLRLDVSAQNEPALRMYSGRGFRPIGEAEGPAGLRYVWMTLGRGEA